jgi:dolichol-phosphate mannosyltransferase
MMKRTISIVVPLRNEERNIPELFIALENLSNFCSDEDLNVELIINQNASSDSSQKLLEDRVLNHPEILLNNLLTPLSFQSSIQNMMKQANGDALLVFQSDLQDPVDVAKQFIKEWEKGNDIVVGIAESRSERWYSTWMRNVFYKILISMSDGRFLAGFQDFYLVSRRVYEDLSKLPSEGLFLRGHISSRYGSVKQVFYKRDRRINGKSNFNFAQKYTLALDGILLFGTRFIRYISVLSFLTFIISILSTFTLLFLYLIGIRPVVTGWSSIAIALLLIISIIGMTTGLVLEYLVRIYRVAILSNFSRS